MSQIYLVVDNVRSLYNVGALFRIADGIGVTRVYLTGLTGYPSMENDPRPPWEVETVTRKIHKTALGAEQSVSWEYFPQTKDVVLSLTEQGVHVVALERTESSRDLYEATIAFPVALIVGHEREGVSTEVMDLVDQVVHLPMLGDKQSLNVATATSAALYELLRRRKYLNSADG